MNFSAVHSLILQWYSSNCRDLPWRKSKDPYRIWISEIMLQQTRVETVIPYYDRFIRNFPTIQELAVADTDKLLNLWAGLGYYSRARNLQAAAKQAVENFGGQLPNDLEDLRSLKGIGAYTSAAIASIAFDRAYAAIDGNLERVLSRLLALRQNPKTDGRGKIKETGQSLVQLGHPGDLNQAFMDLASAICLPKEPNCPSCPLIAHCEARKLGVQREIPLKKKKAPPTELMAHGLAVVSGNELLLARRPQGQWLSGMWDIPWWIEGKTAAPPLPANSAQFASCAQTRTITKHKIYFQVAGLSCDPKPSCEEIRALPGSEFRWVSLDDLHSINLPRPSEKALEDVLGKLHSCKANGG